MERITESKYHILWLEVYFKWKICENKNSSTWSGKNHKKSTFCQLNPSYEVGRMPCSSSVVRRSPARESPRPSVRVSRYELVTLNTSKLSVLRLCSLESQPVCFNAGSCCVEQAARQSWAERSLPTTKHTALPLALHPLQGVQAFLADDID